MLIHILHYQRSPDPIHTTPPNQTSLSLTFFNRTSSSSRRTRRLSTTQSSSQSNDPYNSQPQRQVSDILRPCLALSKEDAVIVQLKCLCNNNFPHNDHGLQLLYRFADIDPWDTRSSYFGGSHDLGQWERFRRMFYTKPYSPLLCLTDWDFLSSLDVAEDLWRCRVHVFNEYRREDQLYEVTMRRLFGGPRDGVWMTKSWIADGVDKKDITGVI